MNALSRRGLLGSSGATLAVRPAAVAFTPAGHPDAILLALCAEFIALDLDGKDKAEGPHAILDDEAYEAYHAVISRRMFGLSKRLLKMPVHTTDGVHAIASCLAQVNGEGHHAFDHPGTMPKNLLDAVMRGAKAVTSVVPV